MQLSALIGKKQRQTSGFLQNGKRVPLTAVSVMGNVITQIKTTEKEGYSAIQLAFDSKKKANKRDLEKAKKAGLEKAPRFFKEVKVDDLEGATLGSQIEVASVFAPGDVVDVTGKSKGKGFAGGVKRHNFAGGPKTHGQSDRHRAPGSIGQGTTPGRVYKGKRMAGRMGTDTVTVKNLEIIEIQPDGVLLIKGLVPGYLGSIVKVTKVGENKKFQGLYKPASEEVAEEAPVQEKPEAASEEAQASEKTEEKQEEVKAEAAEAEAQTETQNGEVKKEAAEENSQENKEEVTEDAGK